MQCVLLDPTLKIHTYKYFRKKNEIVKMKMLIALQGGGVIGDNF